MSKELALQCRIKEPVTLDNLRDVIKEAIEAGGYLTEEKLEEDTECAYNYYYSNNAIMIAFANLLGLEGKLYALRNGMLELPNIKRKDCEIVSDSSGNIWEILLHKLDNGLWIAHTNTYSVVGYWAIFLEPYACRIYPSREAALRYEAQYFLNSYNTIETKNPKWAPYLEQAIDEAKKLGEIR
nr:MAG TPA: hypothetical protein [Caudoviricetes sp.]